MLNTVALEDFFEVIVGEIERARAIYMITSIRFNTRLVNHYHKQLIKHMKKLKNLERISFFCKIDFIYYLLQV